MPKKIKRNRMMTVRTSVSGSGFTVTVNRTAYRMRYPTYIWTVLSPQLRKAVADHAAVFFTYHMLLDGTASGIAYRFPPPTGLSVLQAGMLFSLPSAVLEFPDARFTEADLLRSVYNSGYRITFDPYRPHVLPQPDASPFTGPSVLPFSFGKDSLLTFAVMRRMRASAMPVFFLEPTSHYENDNKEKLRKKFVSEFGTEIIMFRNTLGGLRDGGGQMWGWDMLLTQYTLLLAPFLYRSRSAYLLWSNERSVMPATDLPSGYTVNPNWEQSQAWMGSLHALLSPLGVRTTVTSLVQPLHELAELYILHRVFPDIGKYQLSCFNDTDKKKNKRWCGSCHECARVFMFLMAVGVDPATVGFTDSMLFARKNLFHIFSDKPAVFTRDIVFQSYDERILSFYIAYRRGVRGGVMDLFIRSVLPKIQKRVPELIDRYLTVHDAPVMPQPYRAKLIRLYGTHVREFRREVTRDRPAPVGISV